MWRRLLTAIRRSRGYFGDYHGALTELRKLPLILAQAIAGRLVQLAQWGHESAVRGVAATVPVATLRHAAALRVLRPHRLLEADGPWPDPEPEDLQRVDLLDMLFPAPSRTLIDLIVYGSGQPGQPSWLDRIASLSRLASPETLAATVASGFAQGWTLQQIAAELLPIVDNVRASARRIARTEGMRISHETQMVAWDGLGDMVIGYQIHAVHGNPNTRHWHRDRDGTVYHRRPAAGQLGLDRMPRPPMESPDPRDRPAGAPQVAPNCMCWLSPVLDTA